MAKIDQKSRDREEGIIGIGRTQALLIAGVTVTSRPVGRRYVTRSGTHAGESWERDTWW